MDIKLQNVGKRYRREWIFKDLNYAFQQGEKYAILGHNGAGKSTLMRILSGHLSPSSGKIDFIEENKNINTEDCYRNISYAAPYIDLIEEFTLRESLAFHQKFKPFLKGQNIKSLIKLLNFERSEHKEIRFFSSGMKQRLKLVLAICSDTPTLLLDEPTSNLDEQGVAWYQELIAAYAQDRLLIIASNIAHDYTFCEHRLNITDFKGAGKK